MKLSTRARYALRMMNEIARHEGGDSAISLAQIAKSTKISRRYLEQLAIDLKQSDLVKGIAGKGGGYVLERPSAKISIADIIEAAIGPINIVECVRLPETCIKADLCECRWIYLVINSKITEVLNGITLADLVEEDRLKEIAQQYVPGISNIAKCSTTDASNNGGCP